MSLSKLLSRAGVPTLHELKGIRRIAWMEDFSIVKEAINSLQSLHDQVGDVSLWWLPHVPQIREAFPYAEFLALKRPRQEVITSFLSKTGFTNASQPHWSYNPKYPHDWDKCFPNFGPDSKDKGEQIGCYHDLYYERCDRFEIPVFDMEDLNTENGVKKILACVGIEADASELMGIKKNAIKKK